jgi:hypothetical protein
MKLDIFILSLLMTFGLSACSDSPPPIGAHLPGNFKVASDAFEQRMQARFPVGSDEGALRDELGRERFVITRDPKSPFSFNARYTAGELVCRADWDIRWSVFAEKIESIGAGYAEICL